MRGNKIVNEKRNFTKAKTLMVLKEIMSSEFKEWRWISVPDLARASGNNPDSLAILLPRWVRWGYVKRHSFGVYALSDNRAHHFYQITNHGISYIDSLMSWYPYAQKARDEIYSINFDSEINDIYIHTSIRIKPIWWHKAPMQYRVPSIHWPFVDANDARDMFGVRGGIHVADARQAIEAAAMYFQANVTRACINKALEYEAYFINEGIESLKVRAGAPVNR